MSRHLNWHYLDHEIQQVFTTVIIKRLPGP
jgi:hypothetical protein